MLFSPDIFLQKLHQELQTAFLDLKISYDAITNLYKKFCNFFHGCDKVEPELIKLLAYCCLKYIDCVQNHIDNTSICGEIHIETLKELIAVVGDISKLEGVKDAYLLYVTIPIFKKIAEPDVKIWFSKELLRNFNIVVQGTRRHIRHNIVENHLLHLCKLADIICTCGDYDYQVMLLEAIFRMCSETHITQYAHDLFPTSAELENGLCSINKDHFDRDVRTFLNMVNSKLKRVLSVKCEIVQLGNKKITAPKDPEQGELPIWADFNLGTKTITIFCDRNSLRTGPSLENSDDEDFELITVNVADINNVFVSRFLVPDAPSSVGFIILFNMTGSCSVLYPSSAEAAKATELKLAIYNCLEMSQLLEKLLPNWFGANFKNMTPPNPDFNRPSNTRPRLQVSGKGVYQPLEFDALSDTTTDTIKESSFSVASNSESSSQEEPKISKLKVENTAAPTRHIGNKKSYKPLVTEDAVLQSRPASALSSKSSTSDALSLKDKLRAHQAKHLIRTEKLRISKRPKIRDVEQLKEVAADPELTLLAKRQEENRILAKKGQLLTETEATQNVADISDDVIHIEDNIVEQRSHTDVTAKCCLSYTGTNEIIKVKWPWPKKVSVNISAPASVPEMAVAVDDPIFQEEWLNNVGKTTRNKNVDKKNKNRQQQKNIEKCSTENQLADTAEDKIIPFLPTLENDSYVKISKSEGSMTKQKKVAPRTLVCSEDHGKSETVVNTESTNVEQPSTLQILISGDLCGSTEPGSSMKNTEQTLVDSPRSLENLVGKMMYGTTDNVEANSDNLELEQQKTVEKHNKNQIAGDSKDQTQIRTENTEIQEIDLTRNEGNELRETIRPKAEKILNCDSESNSKRDNQVDTEKVLSSDIVESSQLEENVKLGHKIMNTMEKPQKRGRSAKLSCISKRSQRKTSKTTKDNEVMIQTNAESSTSKLLDNNITSQHGEVSKENEKKKTSGGEDSFKTCFVMVKPFHDETKKHDCEMRIRSIKDGETKNQAKTNEIQEPLNEETQEDLNSEPKTNENNQIKRQLEMEATFDNLLEEFKASQKSTSPIKTSHKKTSTTIINQDETQKQGKNDEDKAMTINLTNTVEQERFVKLISCRSEPNEPTVSEVAPVSESADDYTRYHCKVSEKHKKATDKEGFKTCHVMLTPLNIEKSLKERESKIEKTIKKKADDQVKTNETQTPLNREINKKSLQKKHTHDKLVQKEEKPLKENTPSKKDQISKSNCEKTTTEETYLTTYEILEEVPKEDSSQEFVQEPKLARKSQISQTKRKSKMKTTGDKWVQELSTAEGANKQDKYCLETCESAQDKTNEVSLQEYMAGLELRRNNKISQKNGKTEVKTKTDKPLQNEEPSNEETSRKSAEDLRKDTSSKEFCEKIISIKKGKILEKVRKSAVGTRHNKTSHLTIKGRKSERISKRNEKKVIKTADVNLQSFNEQPQDSKAQKENILTVEATQLKIHMAKTNEDQSAFQSETEQNLTRAVDDSTKRKVLRLPSDDDEKIQNKETITIIEKADTSNTNEDQLLNIVVNDKQKILQSLVVEKLPENDTLGLETVKEVQAKEIAVVDRTDTIETNENLVQNTTNTDKLQKLKSVVEEQLKGKKLEENDTPALKTVEEVQAKEIPVVDRTDTVETNEILVQNTTNTDKLQKLKSVVEEQLKGKKLEVNDITALKKVEEVQAKEIPVVDRTDTVETNEILVQNTTNTDKLQKLQSVVEEQLKGKELEENDTLALKTVEEVQAKEVPVVTTNTEEVQAKEIPVVDRTDTIETNEILVQNTTNTDKLQKLKSVVEEQLKGKKLEVNDITALKKVEEVQAKEIPVVTTNTDLQQKLQSFVVELPYKELEQNDISALEAPQPIASIMETNNDQSFVQNKKSNKITSSRNSSNIEQLQGQDKELDHNIIEEEQPAPVEIVESVSNFDPLLLQGTLSKNIKRKISPDKFYHETPKKRRLGEPDHGEKMNKTKDKTMTPDSRRMKRIQGKARKLYNLDDASYFDDGLTIREEPSNSTSHLVDESLNKEVRKQQKTNDTSNVVTIVEESLITFCKSPKPILATQNRNRKEIQNDFNKLEKPTTVMNQDQNNNRIVCDSKKSNKYQNNKIDEASIKCHKDKINETSIKCHEDKINEAFTECHTDLKQPPRKTPTHQNRLEESHKDKINETSTKCHKDKINKASTKCDTHFKTPTHQNRLEELILRKLTKTGNEVPKRRSQKRSKNEEKENCKKRRASWEPEPLTRSNPFESVTYTGAHLNSPKQLERNNQFDLLMQSLNSTLKEYTTVINDPKKRKSYKTNSNKKNNDEYRYKKLNTREKQRKSQSSQTKDKENQNIFRYYKKLLTQLSSPLPELDVEKEVMEITVIDLSDLENETDQGLRLNAEPKIPSKINKNVQNDASLVHQSKFAGGKNVSASIRPTITIEDYDEVKENTLLPPVSTIERADDEYYPVSPIETPTKTVQMPKNIGSWVEGATIMQEIQKLNGQISNIQLVVLNIQNMLREDRSTKSAN